MNKKTLIITGFNDELIPWFTQITNKKPEELLVLNSFGEVISQPYGCLIRDTVLAVYSENIEEIYVIGKIDKSLKSKMNEEEILMKMRKSGVTQETLKTIEYINVVGDSVLKWLIGPPAVEETIKKNIELIRNHPLIPESMAVNGFIVNSETCEFADVYDGSPITPRKCNPIEWKKETNEAIEALQTELKKSDQMIMSLVEEVDLLKKKMIK